LLLFTHLHLTKLSYSVTDSAHTTLEGEESERTVQHIKNVPCDIRKNVPCNTEVDEQHEKRKDKELERHRETPSDVLYDNYCNEQT